MDSQRASAWWTDLDIATADEAEWQPQPPRTADRPAALSIRRPLDARELEALSQAGKNRLQLIADAGRFCYGRYAWHCWYDPSLRDDPNPTVVVAPALLPPGEMSLLREAREAFNQTSARIEGERARLQWEGERARTTLSAAENRAFQAMVAIADGYTVDAPALDELGLSTRVRNVLVRCHISTVADLLAIPDLEALPSGGLGPKSLEEIRTKLAQAGYGGGV